MSLDILIAGKYRLGRKLGGGSFGEIYLGTNLQTGEEVGIKLVSCCKQNQLRRCFLAIVLAYQGWGIRRNPSRHVTHNYYMNQSSTRYYKEEVRIAHEHTSMPCLAPS